MLAFIPHFIMLLVIVDPKYPPYAHYEIYSDKVYASMEECAAHKNEVPEGTIALCFPVPYPVRKDDT